MKRLIFALMLAVPISLSANTNDPNFDPNIAMRDRYSIPEPANYVEFDVELTYYTDLYVCNGRSDKLTASGVKLNSSTVAVPRKKNSTKPLIPFGTTIHIDGVGERTVQDTGSPKYIKVKDDGTMILDVYMPRLRGETDTQYKARIMKLGRVKSKAKYMFRGEQ